MGWIDFPFDIASISVATMNGGLVVAAANRADGPDELANGLVALRQTMPGEHPATSPGIAPSMENSLGVGRIANRIVAFAAGREPVDAVTLEPVSSTARDPLVLLNGVTSAFGPTRARQSNARGELRLSLERPSDWPVTAVAWGRLGDHDIQIRGSHGGAVWIFDRESGTFVAGPFADMAPVSRFHPYSERPEPKAVAVAFGELGHRPCVAVSTGATVEIYDLHTANSLPAPKIGRNFVSAIAVGNVGSTSIVVTGSTAGAVLIYDASTLEKVTAITMDDPIARLWLMGRQLCIAIRGQVMTVLSIRGLAD
jgi:hypothetical protein